VAKPTATPGASAQGDISVLQSADTLPRAVLGPNPGLPAAERKERTAELIARAREASGEERDRLLDEVVVLNIGVAHSLAARYRNRGIPLEDLEQVACMALTKVVRAFRPDRGEDLLVFAVPSILGELKRHFRDSSWTVRPPRRLQELRPRISAVREQLANDLGRSPTVAEIAAELDHPVDEVAEAIACADCAKPTSLDETLPSGEGSPLSDRISVAETGFDQAEVVALLAPACRKLKDRDREVIRMRFYEQRTQQEIADALGVTQVQVSRLLARIMRDLRRSIAPREHAAAA